MVMTSKTKRLLRGLAWATIFGSHAYMLIYGLPENQMLAHAVGNIIAGGILWSIK